MTDLTAAMIKKIRTIQFQSTRLADDALVGAYKSAFRGKGMEFEDVREYEAGDDIRTIDWNVTARMQNPFVKRFREERELTVTLAVDISASTRYGTKSELKSTLIAEVAAVLAFSAIKNNDKVALLLFSSDVELYLPPKKGTRHVLRVIRELLAFTPTHQGTDVAAALAYLGKVQRHGSICFLISDFICPDFAPQATLIAKRHDLISLAISDPAEHALPEMSLVTFEDLETGETHLIDTSSLATNAHLKSETEARLKAHEMLMKRVGATSVSLITNEPYLPKLTKLFKVRQMRRR